MLPSHARRWLLVVLCAGACLRLALSFNQGGQWDLDVNRKWAESAMQFGIVQSYVQQVDGNMLPNHGPTEITLYAITGRLHALFVGGPMQNDLASTRFFLKLPGMLADLLACVLLFMAVRRMHGRKAGVIAAAVYALHPAVLHDSAVWGQTDGVYTMLIVAMLTSFLYRRHGLATVSFGLACLCKPQAGLFLPLFLVLVPLRLSALLDMLNAGIALLAAVALPFLAQGLLDDLVRNVYMDSFHHMERLSWSAYNAWWALLGDRAGGASPHDLLLGVVSYKTAGAVVLLGGIAAVIALLRRGLRGVSVRARGKAMFAAGSFIAATFFLFQPGVHERYMFPVLALGIPYLFQGGRSARAYAACTGLFYLNLILVQPYGEWDRAFYSLLPNLPSVIAAGQVAAWVMQWRCCVALRGNGAPARSWARRTWDRGLRTLVPAAA